MYEGECSVPQWAFSRWPPGVKYVDRHSFGAVGISSRRSRVPFATTHDRIAFFRWCGEQEEWIFFYWLVCCIGDSLDLRWMYHRRETRDGKPMNEEAALVEVLHRYFRLLIDAAFSLDTDLSRKLSVPWNFFMHTVSRSNHDFLLI